MRFRVAALALAGAATFGGFSARSTMTVTAQQTRSQWDGIYTDGQAKRGEPLYAEHCASCHGADLAGAEMSPGLTGSDFNSNWNNLSIGELFERMRTTMPSDDPGKLSRQQNADILAYMLFKSSAPSGASELPPQIDVLNDIKFIAQRPAP